MIGTRPLRIPNKVLETGDDPRYREDMETIERLVNSLTAASAGFAGLPFDGIVDYSQTPDHVKGVYETPFVALDDLCNNKKVVSPTVVVVMRKGTSPGFYLETADVAFGAGSTLNTGIKILCFFPQEPAIIPQGWWDTAGHMVDLNGGTLWMEGADLTTRLTYPSGEGPFQRCGGITAIRCSSTDTIEALGWAVTTPVNQIYLDCWLPLTFVGQVGTVEYFGGVWYGLDTMIRLNRTANPAGSFTMIGTRIISPQDGNATFGGSANKYVFRSCKYESPSEFSSGLNYATLVFNTTAAYIELDIFCGNRNVGMISVTINDTTLSYLRIRGGPILNFTMAAGSENTATIDIDCFFNNPATVRGALGTLKFISPNAGHTIIGLHGGRIDAAVRDSGATNVTIFIFQSVVQCKIDIGYFTNGIATGLTPYNFDVNSNNNMLDFAGASQCPNPGVNAGAGNVIRTS